MLSWNHNQLGQVPGLPKLIPGHLYRARWIASVPCAVFVAAPVDTALQALGFGASTITTDSNTLYGMTPPWPESRKGIPDAAGPSDCTVYSQATWAGAELAFIPEVFTSIPGLRIWDLWDEDADPTERDLVRRGVAVTPTAPPPLPPIVPPVTVPPVTPPPVVPPVTPPPTGSAPKKKSSVAWLWLPVVGLAGVIFVGTLRKAR